MKWTHLCSAKITEINVPPFFNTYSLLNTYFSKEVLQISSTPKFTFTNDSAFHLLLDASHPPLFIWYGLPMIRRVQCYTIHHCLKWTFFFNVYPCLLLCTRSAWDEQQNTCFKCTVVLQELVLSLTNAVRLIYSFIYPWYSQASAGRIMMITYWGA